MAPLPTQVCLCVFFELLRNVCNVCPRRSSSEILPRSSSGKHNYMVESLILEMGGVSVPSALAENLSPKEIGQPILDIILEPGDLLYFPRGIIHQV